MKVLVQFELLGPKDRKLVAPSVRAGRCDRQLPEHRRCATVCAGPSGLSGYEKMEFPVLTDGATNFRSFGPEPCLRSKLNQHPLPACAILPREDIPSYVEVSEFSLTLGKALRLWRRLIFTRTVHAAMHQNLLFIAW